MSASATMTVLHPARFVRTYGLAFGAIWCLIVLVGMTVSVLRGSAGVVVWSLLLVTGFVIVWRTIGTRVVLLPDEMHIRNFWRTTVVLRGQIEDFRMALPTGPPFSTTVHVLLRGPLMIALEATRSMGFGGQAHSQLCVQQLNAWLASSEDDPV